MNDDHNSALDVISINAGYNKIPVIHDVNFSVNKGEFFGLIGLNGAGKTTLMKTILGLREQLSGSIKVNGFEKSVDSNQSQMAYLPERFEPPWFLSGLEFLKFSLKLYKQDFNIDQIYEAADKLALDRKALSRRVHTYSKGMRQKLGLLGTVLTQCNLFMLDEPMSGLDPLARTLVKDMLVETKAQNNTIFLSSHILADMDEICDRIAVLYQGRIQYVGTPKDFKKQTSSENLERAFLHFIEKDKAA